MAEDRFNIVGKIVARTYEVQAVVAEGGFGVVYRAYHQGFRAEVALKCLKIPNELTDEQRRAFLEQFRGEAEVLFRLSAHNPHIVRPLHVDAFHTAEQKLVPFMALEWLEGRTLDALIIQRAEADRPPLQLAKLVHLLTPVASALEHAHNLPGKNGIETVIHRDMKPENLFIARIGNADVAKILDFGISKVKSTAGQMAGKASVNADALVSFSPAFGSPEQWAPRRYGQTGRWTDVWGLALSIVEAAKGDEVISGDQAAMMGTILDPQRRPTPRNEGVVVNDATEAVFARALAVDPRDRYQSIGQFWDDLTNALGIQHEVGTVSLGARADSARRITTGFDSVAPSAPTRVSPAPGSSGRIPVSAAANSAPHRSAPHRSAPHRSAPHASAPQQAAPQRSTPQSGAATVAAPLTALEVGGFGGGMPPATPRARSPVPQASWAPPERSIWKDLSPAFALVGLSVAVTLLDRAYAHVQNVPLSLGPLRASWVAGGLMVLALLLGISVVRRAMND